MNLFFEHLADMTGNGDKGSTVHNGDKLINIMVAISAILYNFNTLRVRSAKATFPIPVAKMFKQYPSIKSFTSDCND